MVQHYFFKERVQVLAAVRPALRQIFFQKFCGETLNDIRLRYCYEQDLSTESREEGVVSDECFVNIDLQRARDIFSFLFTFLRTKKVMEFLRSTANTQVFFIIALWGIVGFSNFMESNIPISFHEQLMGRCH